MAGLERDCTTNQVNGKSVINFTVAHSEKFKDNQGVFKKKRLFGLNALIGLIGLLLLHTYVKERRCMLKVHQTSSLIKKTMAHLALV